MSREEFLNVFYNEYDGIDVRFRNGQYIILENEINIIKEYVKDIVEKVKNGSQIETIDLKNVIKLIEVLVKSPNEDCELLLQHIYSQFDAIVLEWKEIWINFISEVLKNVKFTKKTCVKNIHKSFFV